MIVSRCGITPASVFIGVLLLTVSYTTLLYADDPPIFVEADHMTSLEKSFSVLFKGNVDAKQGDVQIRSDEMTVYYTQKDDSTKNEGTGVDAKQKVEKLVCVGNVEVTRNEWLGTSNKMYYLSKERQVILIDNAKAWQGPNMVSGSKIIYYLDENRSEVIGNTTGKIVDKKSDKKSSRVKMTIIPGEK